MTYCMGIILSSKAMDFWMNSIINSTEHTKKMYKRYFLQFCEFTSKTPDEMYSERVKHQNNGHDDPREKSRYEILVKGFIKHSLEKYSVGTCKIKLAAIKSFFSSQNVPLNVGKLNCLEVQSFGIGQLPKKN